jgi:hypothetical protein
MMNGYKYSWNFLTVSCLFFTYCFEVQNRPLIKGSADKQNYPNKLELHFEWKSEERVLRNKQA